MDQQQRQAAAHEQQKQQQQQSGATTGDSTNRSQRLHQLRAQHQKRHAEQQRQSTHTPTEQFEYGISFYSFCKLNRRMKFIFVFCLFFCNFFFKGPIIKTWGKSLTDVLPVTIRTMTWGNHVAGQLSVNPILWCPSRQCPQCTTTITTNFNSSKELFETCFYLKQNVCVWRLKIRMY